MATTAPRTASSGGGGGGSGDGAAATRTSSLFACVVTLSNTLLGVSVVGVAGGFARAGSAVGTFSLLLFACLSGCGLHLLARSSMTVSAAAKRMEDAKEEEAEENGVGGRMGKEGRSKSPPPSSFRAVALVGAPRWAFLIDVSVALKCFGVATSYLVVIGDLMPTAMADILGDSHPDSLLLSRHLWVTVGFFLVAPLAFSRTLGALKYTATLAIGLVVFLAAMVMSFWLLPGLDACPDRGQTAVELMLEDAGDSGEDAGTSGEGVGGYAARTILSSALEGVFTPAPAVAAAVASVADGGGVGSAEDVYGSALGEGEGGEDDFEFGEGGGSANGESCFEGSNIVASVRTILQTLPIFVFTFTCHQNIFTICNEIVRPTAARIDAVIVCAMLVATSTYLCLCWGAYATFGVGVDGDLLETYPRTGLLTAARICVSLLVLSCYPLQAHPSRLCILSTWKAFSEDMHEAYSSLPVGDEEAEPGTQRAAASPPSIHPPQRRGISASGSLGSGSSLSSSGGDAASRSSSPSTVLGNSGIGVLREGNGNGKGEGAPSEGERGRRRVGGGSGTSRAGGGAGDGFLASPELEAQQEAELAALISGAPPARQSEALVSPSDVTSKEVPIGGGDGVDEGLYHLRDTQGAGGDSTDAALSGAVGNGLIDKPQQENGGQEEGEAFWSTTEGFRHVLVTGAFLALSYLIAMSLDDLGVLLEVVGATGSTTIAFILPGLLYLKVHPDPHPKRSLAALQLTVGLLIIPVALTFIALGDAAEGRR